jgi:hypothetical protein
LRKVIYRKALLEVVEAFLEGNPASVERAHRIVKRCYAALGREYEPVTLNDITWGMFIKALTDSVFYESEEFLRETREILLGRSPRNIARTIFREDYRVYFTPEEEQWYAQLVSMLDFILATPFTKIHEATYEAWKNRATWETIRPTLPEAVLAEKIDEEYQQRKALIENISANRPLSEDVGDETIYHLVLREVTSILTAVRVGHAAIVLGYPVLDAPYTDYRSSHSSEFSRVDMTKRLLWTNKYLDALAGKEELFISWRLSHASTFDGDMLLVFFQ